MATGWSKSPVALIHVVEDDVTNKRKEMALAALQGVISASPVDTGAFKANHRVTVDSVTYDYDLSASDQSGSATMAEGEGIIAAIKSPYGEITIQNNLPYADALENGHSQQAPIGVYGVTFQSVKAKYQ